MDARDRFERMRDSENFRVWRLSRMTFWGLLLESFSPSPASVEEMNYYFRTFDTDGIPYAVKAQRQAGPWLKAMTGLNPQTSP